ncbi:MAG TPA: hypothetical protein VFF12_07575 [Myxococcaceae bacterium]|nr:hypothetical protein [Myxococcaceae bacterium]
MADLDGTAEEILRLRRRVSPSRALLVGISGVDGSGKGWVTARLEAALREAGETPASIHVDGWLNLPSRRFDPRRPAAHFYEHALRLEEAFSEVVLPLRDTRSCDRVVDLAEETATEFRRHRHRFEDVSVILFEGIFLFKRRFRAHFDLACWVECTFETALDRALHRSQEGLSPAETARAYQTIYFPAQRIHIERDDPRGSADLLIANDPRA